MIGKKGSVGRERFITSQYQEGKMMIMTEEISGSEVISPKGVEVRGLVPVGGRERVVGTKSIVVWANLLHELWETKT